MLAGVIVLFAALRVGFDVWNVPQNGMYPSMPATTKVLAASYLWTPDTVRRGEVIIALQEKPDSSATFIAIWRVVGLPGESVEIRSDVVYVDGNPLRQEPITREGEFRVLREFGNDEGYLIALPVTPGDPQQSNYGPSQIPADSVFLIGDNRHNAYDNRRSGPTPLSSLKGRAIATLESASRR